MSEKEKTALEKLREANVCPECGGKGSIVYDGIAEEFDTYLNPCASCDGSGHKIDLEVINAALRHIVRKFAIETEEGIYRNIKLVKAGKPIIQESIDEWINRQLINGGRL